VGVFEVARIAVKARAEASFAEGMKTGAAIIAGDPGCRGVQVLQGVEGARDFIVIIDWNGVEEHRAFRDGPRFADYRATISGFLDGPPSFSHFEVRIDVPAD
jgi:heme-degrading monooxygenase HmoA